MDSESSEGFECTPPNIIETAQNASIDLLPKKSSKLYELKYDSFMDWCQKNKIKKNSENVLVAYFSNGLKQYKPSTLWSISSMLKTTLKIKNEIDISKFHKLVAYIKNKNKGFQSKKSKIFEKEQFIRFLAEAPDSTFLMIKAAFIIGISGACRREELMKLRFDDIEDRNTVLIIRIPETKNYTERIFTILNPSDSKIDYIKVIRDDAKMRPTGIDTPRFFFEYANSKCTKQPAGNNMFGKMPSIIAKFPKNDNDDITHNASIHESVESITYDFESDFNADENLTTVSINNESNNTNMNILKSPNSNIQEAKGFAFSQCSNCTFNINVVYRN